MSTGLLIYGGLVLSIGLVVFFLLAKKMEFKSDYKFAKWVGGIMSVCGVIIIGVSFHPQIIMPHETAEARGEDQEYRAIQAKYQHALIEMRNHADDVKTYNYWNAEAQLLKNKLNQMDNNN